jgi:hypothetical protein
MRAVSEPSVAATALACAILAVACGIRSPLDGPAPVDADADADAGALDARGDGARADAPHEAAPDSPADSPAESTTDAPAESGTDARGDAPPDAPPDAPTDSPADSPAVLPAPRPVAPLSTSTATSQQPTFRWALDPGSDGAKVEICSDRACTKAVQTFSTTGTSGKPTSPLAAGVYFWRLHGTTGGAVHAGVSPTWEVFVGAGSAPVDTSWGSVPDVNGDGLADALVGQISSDGPGVLYAYSGYASDYRALQNGTAIGPPPAMSSGWFGLLTASAGDVDGDGYPETIVSDAYDVYILAGGPAGSAAPISLGVTGVLVNVVTGAGDVDGDGYADVALGLTLHNGADGEILVYRGGPDGVATTPQTIYVPVYGFGLHLAAGDFNGDGYGDLATTAGVPTGTMYVYAGSAGGLSATPLLISPVTTNQLKSVGDVNGDGYGDMVFSGVAQLDGGTTLVPNIMFGGPAGPTAPRELPAWSFDGQLAMGGDFNGDGYGDVLLGVAAPGGPTSEVIVLYGAAAPLLPAEGYEIGYPPQTGGYVVFSSLGDVNGDGFSDVLVGVSNIAESYLFLGPKKVQTLPEWDLIVEGSTSVL